jgi:hypothetical protein
MDVPRQADPLKQRDYVPGHVELPPLEAVARREAKGVVVVVPLAKGDHRDPPAQNKETCKWSNRYLIICYFSKEPKTWCVLCQSPKDTTASHLQKPGVLDQLPCALISVAW